MPEAASFVPSLLFSFPCLFSFLSGLLIQSFLNLVFLSTGAGTGQGQENDNIRSFSGQIRSAATCTQTGTNTAMMDGRSHAKGVNMIHGSFVGIRPYTHTHECSQTLSTVLVFQQCTLLSTHFFIMPDGFHLWHFTSNKPYYTV